jgi:hypothetical protein
MEERMHLYQPIREDGEQRQRQRLSMDLSEVSCSYIPCPARAPPISLVLFPCDPRCNEPTPATKFYLLSSRATTYCS